MTGQGFSVGWRLRGVVVVVGAAAVWSGSRKKVVPAAEIAAKKTNLYSTQPGSKSKLELPDGTQVWLNGNSKLTVGDGPFGSTSREVFLSGEAFFDVARNDSVRFSYIHTGTIDIGVLGTATLM